MVAVLFGMLFVGVLAVLGGVEGCELSDIIIMLMRRLNICSRKNWE